MPRPSNRAYWLCQIGGWGLNALLQFWALVFMIPEEAINSAAVEHVPQVHWAVILLEVIVLNGAGLVLTHGLRRHIQRHRWIELRATVLAPRIFIAGFLLGLAPGVAQTPLAMADLQQFSLDTPFAVRALSHALNWAALIWGWCILYFIILGSRRRHHAELRQSELARALQSAELRLLKSQLNPHFLFNSLNSVRALIADDPARAQTAVTQLAKTLRYTLSSNQDELVTLAHEMEIVDDYLAIEALRLGERLTIERNISADAARTRIPVMLLQTVVENAIKHGIAELPAGGALRIAAHLRDGALALDVENPRPATPAPPGVDGIGLRNAAERLRLLFGDTARLELDLSAPGRAATRIRIPVGP